MIRRLLRARLAELRPDDVTHADEVTARFAGAMNTSPIAPLPRRPRTHYGLPPACFGHALGPQRKYSCCHWGPGFLTLAEAENKPWPSPANAPSRRWPEDSGACCGWGSLTLTWRSVIRGRPSSPCPTACNVITSWPRPRAATLECRRVTRYERFRNAAKVRPRVSVEMFEPCALLAAVRVISAWLRPAASSSCTSLCTARSLRLR